MRKTFDNKWFSVDLEEQWSQFFTGEYNWYDFNIIKVVIEKEIKHSILEIELYFLGLGVRVCWVLDEKMYKEKLKEHQETINNPNQLVKKR